MDYKEQLLHPQWQKRRLLILERDNFTCCACGDTETTLHIHHKEYISGKKAWEYEDDVLQTFCKHCHAAAEHFLKNKFVLLHSFKDFLPENKTIVLESIAVNEIGDRLVIIFVFDGDNISPIITLGEFGLFKIFELCKKAEKIST